MSLTLGAGVLYQRRITQPRGVLEDRRGDFDLVIERQQTDHLSGGIGAFGQPTPEGRAGRQFDLLHQLAHDIIEQVDLVNAEVTRAVHE
jgi:hypothetical protein